MSLEPESVTPPPPTGSGDGIGPRKRMSVASKAWDKSQKGFLSEAQEFARKYDKDGDGKIDTDGKRPIFNSCVPCFGVLFLEMVFLTFVHVYHFVFYI